MTSHGQQLRALGAVVFHSIPAGNPPEGELSPQQRKALDECERLGVMKYVRSIASYEASYSTGGTDDTAIDDIIGTIERMGWVPYVGATFDAFANCYWSGAHRAGHPVSAAIHPSPHHVGSQGSTRREAAFNLLQRLKEHELNRGK